MPVRGLPAAFLNYKTLSAQNNRFMTASFLFVCLGNICRSPLAEGALRTEFSARGISAIIDSAGTSDWHINIEPDHRAIAVARRNDVNIAHLRGRQLRASDFRDFDYVIALDSQNLSDLKSVMPSDSTANISMLMDFVEGMAGRDVADPFYSDEAAFDQTWEEVTIAAKAIADKIAASQHV